MIMLRLSFDIYESVLDDFGPLHVVFLGVPSLSSQHSHAQVFQVEKMRTCLYLLRWLLCWFLELRIIAFAGIKVFLYPKTGTVYIYICICEILSLYETFVL